MKLLSVVYLLLLSTVYSQGNEGNSTDSFDVNVSSSYGIQGQPSNTTIVYPTKPQQIQERLGQHEKQEDQVMEPTQFVDDVRYQVHEHFGDENVEGIHFLPTPQAYTSVTNPSPSLREVNHNLDNKEAASYPRPSLPEIQNVLTGVNSQELDVGKIPKHSKIVEVVRVPAVYELHLESDANRVLKLNPWTKELMSQSSNIDSAYNGPQHVYHSVNEIPSLAQYDTSGDKYNFDKIPQELSNLQLENIGEPKPMRAYGRGKNYRQQMQMQPQYQEMSYSYVQPSRGKKKYQPPANFNPAPQQYTPQKTNYGRQQQSSALNFGQQFNGGKNVARPQWNNANNFGQHWSGENNFGHQIRPASNTGQHQYSVGKNYGHQQSSAGNNFGQQLAGEVGYEYYLPSSSNTKTQQTIEEAKYGQYQSTAEKKYPSNKNYGLQISPGKNYGHHHVSGGYEVFGASNPIPQLEDTSEYYKNTQYRIPQKSEAIKSHSKYPKSYNKSPQAAPHWKHAAHYHKHEEVENQPAQEIVYKKPKPQPVQFDEVYVNKYNVKQAEPKHVIPTYSQPKETISYEKQEAAYKPSTQTYEQSVQNFQYSYPKPKKNSKNAHNQKYNAQWNSELNSEYLGDYYKKPQAIHEVPAPVFNGPNPYSVQKQSAPKVIYGKHSEHGPFRPQEYESVRETWQESYPESSEEVKYVHHGGSLESFTTKQVSPHSYENHYNKGTVDSVPNDFHASLQTSTPSSEQVRDGNVKTEVRYEVQNNGGSPVYDSASPKVNYNHNHEVYVEEVPKSEQIPDQDEVQIIFAQNLSTETPHNVEIENNDIQNSNYPKFESHKLNEQGEGNNVQPTKYTSVDFPQSFQPNKNRRMSTPPPLPPPPQINYVLLIKERDIDD